MRISQEPQRFAASFGEIRARGLGLNGDLTEHPSLHTLLATPPIDSHLGVYLDALQQVGLSSWTPPLSFSNIQQTGTQEFGGGYLSLDLSLQTHDADGNEYAYVLLRLHRGITQFVFPDDPEEPPQHPARLAQLVAPVGPIPEGYIRFLVPFDVTPVEPSRLGFATAPLMAPVEQGILHLLRIKLIKWLTNDIEKSAALAIAKWADRKINPDVGMKWFQPGLRAMMPSEIQSLAGNKTLLFVHGIISSIGGAFSGLFNYPPIMNHITQKYGPNAIGFDHYTLSETHLDTAKELVNTLPIGAILDIVCHSRGAAVVRGMLEHPDVAPMFTARKISVNSVIFVAGANGGTPLAHMDNWKVLINVLSYLTSLVPPGPAGVIAIAIAALLKIALEMACQLDSLTMLDPASQFYTDIRKVTRSPANRYMYAQANYDMSQKSSVLAFLLNQVMNDANDLVIPWDRAGEFHAQPRGGAPIPVLQYDLNKVSQTDVYHTDFFAQKRTWDTLIQNL